MLLPRLAENAPCGGGDSALPAALESKVRLSVPENKVPPAVFESEVLPSALESEVPLSAL